MMYRRATIHGTRTRCHKSKEIKMSVDEPIPYVLVDDELPVPYVPVGYDCQRKHFSVEVG